MNKFTYLLFATFPLLFSCNGNEKEADSSEVVTLEKGNRHILIFSDKSLSLYSDSASLSVYKESLKNFLYDNYDQNGDRVKGYYIHANTLGATPFLEVNFSVPEPDFEEGGYQDQQNAKTNYEMARSDAKAACLQPLIESFKMNNESSTNRETDIWATFELMTRFFADATPRDTCYVFFISDMVESVKGEGRRDFHRHSIKDKQEAESMAVEDARWIKDNSEVDPQVLSRIKAWTWIPPGPTADNDFANLRYYWRKLFAELGVEKVREEVI